MECVSYALPQVRLYRVRWAINYLEYNVTLSLLWVMVLRNILIMLYLTHWYLAACLCMLHQ